MAGEVTQESDRHTTRDAGVYFHPKRHGIIHKWLISPGDSTSAQLGDSGSATRGYPGDSASTANS